jgi:hypothetical protein
MLVRCTLSSSHLFTHSKLSEGFIFARKFTPKSNIDNKGIPKKQVFPSLDSVEDECASETPVHFKASMTKHPLGIVKNPFLFNSQNAQGDHLGLQQNHIWTEGEINERMSVLYHHTPKCLSDHLMHKFMYGLYHCFNVLTGYKANNPSVKAIEWRLITLESVAGVPGFVAAGLRHFRSLRTLQRDHGWIPSLLEEAENERMHLLVCLNAFNASIPTRILVYAAQIIMVPLLMGIYLVRPKSMHRLVGYLEETAVKTYINVIKHIDTPGTNLYQEWSKKSAPRIAVGYWKLSKDAKWSDVLKCMMADECNHRDVNHTFAEMKTDDPNPFVESHKSNAYFAWRLQSKEANKSGVAEKVL